MLSPWRPLALVALAAGLAGCGHQASKKVPEGGSSFGTEHVQAVGHQTLLDALAPVLAAPRARARHGSQGRRARPADPGSVLGLSASRAAARLMLVGFSGTDATAPIFERLRVRDFGAVVVEPANFVDTGQLAALAGEFGVVARDAGHAPPVVADDGLPVPMASLVSLHVGMAFGPVADLAVVGGPHEADGFSDDPRAAAGSVSRAVAARTAAGVAAVVGHFPGEGGASGDPDDGPATVGLSVADLRRADLLPFRAVAHRAPAIAMSGALYAGFDGVTPATELPQAVALLRGLGFHGVVVSGDLPTAASTSGSSVGEAAVAALRAGCDLLQVRGDARAQEQAYRALVKALRSGAVPLGHVAASLRRIAALQRDHAA